MVDLTEDDEELMPVDAIACTPVPDCQQHRPSRALET